jgi:hypothetical protein
VDPVEDIKIIHAELRAKDLERVGKLIDVRASLSCTLILPGSPLCLLCAR